MTQETFQQIIELIKNNPKASLWEIAQETKNLGLHDGKGCSSSTIHTISQLCFKIIA
jgi:hypothetical protein